MLAIQSCLLFLGLLAQLPPGPDSEPPELETLALALSGGGARGIAHIGVLKALEENAVPVDFIAGTSMGAVIGALAASGHSWDVILDIVRSLDWESIFSGKPDRALVPPSSRLGERPALLSVGYEFFRLSLPEAALSDYLINRTLERYLAEANFAVGRDFDKLPIPFRAVTTDLRSGQRVVHRGGSLARAVRASMSIPLVFAPVPFGESLLVDGGLVENVPVSVACETGATFVVAVDVTSPVRRPEEYRDLVGIAGQVTDVLSLATNRAHEEKANLTLRPELSGHRFTDYSNFDALVEAGYQATLAEIPRIKELLLHRAETSSRPRAAALLPLDARRVAEVRIVGQTYLPEKLIRRVFGLSPGEPFQLERVLRQMDALYATGFFESAWLDFLAEGDSGVVVVLSVKEQKPRTAELGVAYNDEDKLSAFLRFKNRNLLRLGEQLKIEGRASDASLALRLSLARDRDLFDAPLGYALEAVAEEEKPRFFVGDEFVNRAEFDRLGLSFKGWVGLGRPALVELGLHFQQVETEERLGLPLEPGTTRIRAARFGFLWDDLDDLYRTTSGRRFVLSFEKNLPSLGASADFWRASVSFRAAARVAKRHVLSGRAFLGVSEGDLPPHEQFRLGGPFFLPGYHRDSLWGNEVLGISAGYDFLFTPRFRFRSWAGAGDVWETVREITLGSLDYGAGAGLEYASPIGPISVDFGRARSGASKLYFAVGFH